MMAVTITTSPTFTAGTPRVLFEGAFCVRRLFTKSSR